MGDLRVSYPSMTPSSSATGAAEEEEQTMGKKTNRNIPPEILEEILLNLPVKSLLRFSSVSKPWNSAVFRSGFGERYRGRERIVLLSGGGTIFSTASTCFVSSMLPVSNISAVATDFDAPFGYKLEASCNELWLGRLAGSLFLWNPSMKTYKELPKSPLTPEEGTGFVYGLGFERIGGDCKILQIRRKPSRYEAGVYSLKSNLWKYFEIENNVRINHRPGVLVSGRLHWMPPNVRSSSTRIVSFDLSTEEFGETAMPHSPVVVQQRLGVLGVGEAAIPSSRVLVLKNARLGVLRGKLSVSLSCQKYYEVWLMEEYGVAKSWAKKFRIESSGFDSKPLLPLYLFENGEVLVRAGYEKESWCRKTFVYRDDGTKPEEVKIGSSLGYASLYVDSLAMIN